MNFVYGSKSCIRFCYEGGGVLQQQYVEIISWTSDFNQEWVLDKQGNSTYRVGPCVAWWRTLSVYERSTISIMNYTFSDSQQWILTPVLPY